MLYSRNYLPGGLAGKESTCNAGDPGSIPGLGRSPPGEGIGYPLWYSWASLVAQTVKNLPAMWETWVQSLDWEDPLEEGTATHSSILAWRIPMDRGAWWAAVHEVAKSRTRLSIKHSTESPCHVKEYTNMMSVCHLGSHGGFFRTHPWSFSGVKTSSSALRP